MKKLVLLPALLLLWALPAGADWSITIQGPVTISGPGAAPIVIPTPPVTPPVVVPPVTPPKPPPVVVVPPPVVPRDTTPFVFPANCPRQPWNGSGERSYILGSVPLPDFGTFYAIADGAGNPAGISHTCACIIKPGASIKGQGGQPDKNVGDLRLWVPIAAAGPFGDEIRRACETGRLSP